MVAPTFKKATDTDPGDATKFGAPDLKYTHDVLDGTHATDRVQATAIETTGASNVQTDLNNKLEDITNEPLSSLSDVTITAIAANEILKW